MIDQVTANADSGESRKVFGHLTVIRPTDERIRGVTVYECRCECGNLDKATIPLLMMGRKTSCGCQNRTKSEASKPEVHELERLRALVADDGRPLAEIAEAAALAEGLVADGLVSKRRLTLSTTSSLLKALGKHWSDLDEPRTSAVSDAPTQSDLSVERARLDFSAFSSPLPSPALAILPSGPRPRHLTEMMTRNRLESRREVAPVSFAIVRVANIEGSTMGDMIF